VSEMKIQTELKRQSTATTR